jgi:hypothetical protein
MKPLTRWFRRGDMFAIVIGMTDGILTALTLAAGKLLSGARPDSAMALRVSGASALSGAFVFFTAEYARQRAGLVHAERQLNLASHGRLATTRLGEAVRRDTLRSAGIAVACNFAGALLPLICGAHLPGPPWLAIPVAVIALGALGGAVAQSVYGHRILWVLALMAAGLVLSLAGVMLHVV